MPVAQYSQYALSDALAQLASLLGDGGNVYWSQAELTFYIKQALYTWGAYTNYWRERVVVPLTANTPFYDLLAIPAIKSQIGFNVTDQFLYQQILYMLLEPSSPTSYTGSEQFDYDSITLAMTRARDQFLVDTGVILTRRSPFATSSPSIGREVLPSTTLDVRRLAWIDSFGYTTPLWRSSEWEIMSYNGLYLSQQAGTPQVFSVAASPQLQFQVAPVPLASGQFDLITVDTQSELNPATGANPLMIPDNYYPAVLWGALAGLLSKDATVRDPQRADYCQQQYQQMVSVAKSSYASVTNSTINNIATQIVSLSEADSYNPTWQSTSGTPSLLGLAGYNLLFSFPVPDIYGPYSASLDLVRNAVTPTVSTDFIQVSAAEYQAILNYARHLACFKMGGEEFAITAGLETSFMALAQTYNSRLKSSVTEFKSEYDRARVQKSEVVRSSR